MKKIILPLLILVSNIGISQITIDESHTTQELVEDFLISGTCAIVENFTQSTGTNFGGANGIASFDANGTDFPFESGIVLVSGNVASVPGPNLSTMSSGGWPGDADLEANTTATNTNDASWIKFDFTPQTSAISFNFIMASEEYNQNFECQYSDAFAFILTDLASGAVQNLAVLPGTTTPIEVTNIRPEVIGQCGAVNEEYFGQYNFSPFNPEATSPTNFNGQTTTLTAMADVIPDNPYSIKLVLADQADTQFNIGVFLEAGSFNIGDIDLGVDLTVNDENARCRGVDYTIVPDLGNPLGASYHWQYESPLNSGTFVDFVPPENGPTLTVSDTGRFKLTVDFNGNCESSGEVYIEFPDPPVVNGSPEPLVECDSDNDGVHEFNLHDADADITFGNTDLTVTFFGTLEDASYDDTEPPFPTPLPDPYINDNEYNDVVYARVDSNNSSCFEVVELPLIVRDRPTPVFPTEPFRVCDDTTADGITSWNLPEIVPPVLLEGLDPAEFDLYYYILENSAVTAGESANTPNPDFSNAIADPANFFNSQNPQTIYVLVVGNANSTTPNNGTQNCYEVVPIQLMVDPLPENLGPFEYFICDDYESGSTTDEVSIFNLLDYNDDLTGANPDYTVTWFLNTTQEQNNNPLPNPESFANTITPQTIVARITTELECSIVVNVTLTAPPNPSPNTNPTPIELCDDGADLDDGLIDAPNGFDLTLRDAEIIDGDPNVTITYYVTEEEAIEGVAGTEIIGLFQNTIPYLQTVYARVAYDSPPETYPCFTVVPLDLIVLELPEEPITGFENPMVRCDDDGDGSFDFNLTDNNEFVLGTQNPADFEPITYHTDPIEAQNGDNAITDPTLYPSTGETIWVRLASLVTGCVRVTEFILQVETGPTIGVGNDLFECDDLASGTTIDGYSTFDLTVNNDVINLLGSLGQNPTYYASEDDLNNDIPIADPEEYQNEIPVQQEIFAKVLNNFGCASSNSFFINVEPNPTPAEEVTMYGCDTNNDGFYNSTDTPDGGFILSDLNEEVANGETDINITYYRTENGAQNEIVSEVLPEPYVNDIAFTQLVWARVTHDVPPAVLACYTIVPITLEIVPTPDAPIAGFIDPMQGCDDNEDGYAIFNLTDNDEFVLGNQDPDDFAITYYLDEEDANNGENALDQAVAESFENTIINGQTIWVRLENILTGCARVTPFEIEVVEFPELGEQPFILRACDDTVNGSTSTDGISTFNLLEMNDEITLENPNLSVLYFATLEDQQNGDFIQQPEAFQNDDNPQTIFVTVSSNQLSCTVETTLQLRVLQNPPAVEPTPLEVCDDDTDGDPRNGFARFDLTSKIPEIVNGTPDVSVLFYELEIDAIEGTPNAEIAVPEDYENIEANSQTVYVRVVNDVPPYELGCFSVVPLQLIVTPLPDDSAEISDEIVCQFPFTGNASIILDQKDLEVLNGQNPNIFEVYYFENELDATNMNFGNAIASNAPYFFNNTPTTLYVGILNTETGCYISYIPGLNELTFQLVVNPGISAGTVSEPYQICDNFGESDGFAQFTLISDPNNPTDLDPEADALVAQILNGQDPADVTLTFHETLEDAENGTGILPNIYVNIENPQTIYARVTGGDDPTDSLACFDITEVVLIVEFPPQIVFEEPFIICVDEEGNITENENGEIIPAFIDTGLNANEYTFNWYLNGEVLLGENGPSIMATMTGTYEVEITEIATGCSATATAVVEPSSAPFDYTIDVSEAFGQESFIEITVEGLGIYQYQIDGLGYQDEPRFDNLDPGLHTVDIRDTNGCGVVTEEVWIIDYTPFVSRNGDGFNEYFEVRGMEFLDPEAKVYIFDRYGKLLKELNVDDPRWNATYKGQRVIPNDYWFLVEYTENEEHKQFRSHFSVRY